MSEESKLRCLPCPFCGSYAKRTFIKATRQHDDQWNVMCGNEMCRIASVNHGYEYDSIAAWNRRAPASMAEAANAEHMAQSYERDCENGE